MGMTWGEWSVALQTVGMVVVLPVALWMLIDATKRKMPHRWWWVGAWAAATLAISLLVGAVVVAAYLIRRPPRLASGRAR
jgi:NADH:ubiquinone oxidoreductase subunit 6 (subunit J)